LTTSQNCPKKKNVFYNIVLKPFIRPKKDWKKKERTHDEEMS
jgi:hypothetical protein